MELKDVILSTLAEMEDVSPANNSLKEEEGAPVKLEEKIQHNTDVEDETLDEQSSDNEMLFLTSMRERLLVLFEGFQAPNNTNIEAKVDMTLNFLEYVLVTIDTRVQKIEKRNK